MAVSARDRLIAIPMHYPKTQIEWNHFILKLRELLISAFSDLEGQIAHIQVPKSITENRGSAQNIVPITATDAGADATITVAAHTVNHAGVAYSIGGGSVTGLAYTTRYLVYRDSAEYADDPSPTYTATTNPQAVVGNDARCYVGDVTTPAALGAPNPGGGGAGGGGGGTNWP